MANQYQKTVLSVSTASNANGAAVDCSNLFNVSAQVVTTGSPSGTIKLQASNDTPIGSQGFSSGVWSPTNWSDIPLAVTGTISTATATLIPKTDLCYQFIRAVWTGSGTGTVIVNIKTLGY